MYALPRETMTPDDIMISYLPLSHIAAQITDMHAPMKLGYVSDNQSLRFDSIRSLIWLCFQAGFRVKSITDVWHF
jgi:hypothetical protein